MANLVVAFRGKASGKTQNRSSRTLGHHRRGKLSRFVQPQPAKCCNWPVIHLHFGPEGAKATGKNKAQIAEGYRADDGAADEVRGHPAT
jgi:hypothetical protein